MNSVQQGLGPVLRKPGVGQVRDWGAGVRGRSTFDDVTVQIEWI
ncbi:MAG: hypothetical protein RL410_1388 [Actinomycetota bacterium]|jgi:hypothetical protein